MKKDKKYLLKKVQGPYFSCECDYCDICYNSEELYWIGNSEIALYFSAADLYEGWYSSDCIMDLVDADKYEDWDWDKLECLSDFLQEITFPCSADAFLNSEGKFELRNG